GDEARLAALLAQQQRELRGGGRLARALQPSKQDHGRRPSGEGELGATRAHQRRQLVVDDLHDLLAGRDALQHLLAKRPRARLESFDEAMAAQIQAAGGTVEKFAGDAVMAVFGAPEALEDHAERALHAALAMQRRLEEGLALRVGVNTGEVVVGAPREGS